MRLLIAILLLPCSLLAAGTPRLTIQDALKLIPKDQLKNLVRIEAREGDPAPPTWYIQVYDSNDENGLHEYVITGKTLSASRSLSQFLPGIKPLDIVGSKLVRVDSDDLIKLVQRYSEANKLAVSRINYTMLKEADNPAPVWRLVCLDDAGKKLAELVVNARNANVVSHDGFDAAPGQSESTPAPNAASGSTPAVRQATAVKSPSPAASAAASASPSDKRPLFQRMFGGPKH